MTQIVDLPRSERARALEDCFPKDGRSQQQLLSLLDLYDALGLAKSQSGNAAAPRPNDGDPARDDTQSKPLLTIGSTCGPYRVVRRIGEGGMGQVFLAEDPRLARRVALKSLSGQWLEAPNARERLMREARAVAGLAHTNIATLYDVLEEADRLLLVMEYVEGKTIADLLEAGPVPTRQALRIASQIVEAIGYAHDRGVIHCDLKPANIQVADNGVAKVLDFGLARVRYAEAESAKPIPGTSAMLGTPGYIAPERMLFGVLNASGDIYNIGIVLFEMVTGRRLFDPDLRPEQWFDLVNGQPVKASAFVRDLPEQLDGVIERALSAEPSYRYQSAHELGRDLRGVVKALENSSAVVPMPRPIDPFRRPVARRSGEVSAAHVAIGTLTGIALLWLAGFITSGMYNIGLARADFDFDPAIMHLIWGVRSIVMPVVIGVLIMVALGLVTAVCRIPLAVGLGNTRWLGACRAVQQRVASISTLPIAGLAAGLVVAELLVISLLFWRFDPLLSGLSNFLDGSNPSDLTALSPSNGSEHRLYRLVFSVHVLVFAVAWFQLLKLRARRPTREAALVVAGGLALTVVSFLLLVAPYRTLVHSEGEVVSFEGRRCYLVGQRLPDTLLFCPTLPATWSRIVQADNPALTRTGVRDSIFKEAP
jgi:serine/threonine protein kinase